jgi:hypothetical protein
MALTRTSLAADCTASDLQLAITSTSSGFPAVGTYASPQQMMQVDAEYMLIQVVPSAGYVKVMQRGYNGSKAVAHDILAPVTTSSDPQDFAAVADGAVGNRPPWVDAVVSVGENGVIPVPVRNTVYVLTKATALASTTFAAPAKDQDGLRVTFTSQTAAAHVITATGLWGDGASGSPEDTATWDAFIGASLSVVANNGLWNIVSAVGVTIT